MHHSLLAMIAAITPALYFITSLVSTFQPGIRPTWVKRLGTTSAIVGMLVSVACVIIGAQFGPLQTPSSLGFSLRLDSVSILMLGMISLLSYIVMRFSLNYLDGDNRQGVFLGRLAATIAWVQIMVLSGNLVVLLLSWIMTSISLHRLLVFYPNRPGALVAAHKKFILARLGDLSLLAAVVLLYFQFNTIDLETIFQAIKNHNYGDASSVRMEVIAILLVLSAVLKSAQFPTHGWLIEVMETPTPVSALLHAGLLNAGPFLIVRMSFVIDASTFAPWALISIGGVTALFASIVYLTQTSVKTALGYSSVAHMGFSLMVCGLGVYSAAMLHLIAHSFYKAHSFLSSGSAIDLFKSSKKGAIKRVGKPFRIIIGVLIALVVYSGFALLWGIDPVEEFSLLAIGAILVLGLSRIFTSVSDSVSGIKLWMYMTLLSLIVTTSFFTLESLFHQVLSTQTPQLTQPGAITMSLIGVVLAACAIVVAIQIVAPALTPTQNMRTLQIHFRNGFYMNAYFDKLIQSLSIQPTKIPSLSRKDLTLKSKVESVRREAYQDQSL